MKDLAVEDTNFEDLNQCNDDRIFSMRGYCMAGLCLPKQATACEGRYKGNKKEQKCLKNSVSRLLNAVLAN